MEGIEITEATDADRAGVQEVLQRAFNAPAEAALVQSLREDGDLSLELVAKHGGMPVGVIVLSRMQSPEGTLGLGPIAVSPEHQGKGIGAALMKEAIRRARSGGAHAVFLLGDPSYYSRFGFSVAAATPFKTPFAGPYFQMLELSAGSLERAPKKAEYASAFSRFE